MHPPPWGRTRGGPNETKGKVSAPRLIYIQPPFSPVLVGAVGHGHGEKVRLVDVALGVHGHGHLATGVVVAVDGRGQGLETTLIRPRVQQCLSGSEFDLVDPSAVAAGPHGSQRQMGRRNQETCPFAFCVTPLSPCRAPVHTRHERLPRDNWRRPIMNGRHE